MGCVSWGINAKRMNMKRRFREKYQFVKLNTRKAIMLKKLAGYNVEARFPTVFSPAD